MSVLATIAIGLATLALGTRLLEPNDLAKGKPWRTSSSWGTCEPEKGRCGGSATRILFHTLEEDSPWFEYDLGQPTTFSSVLIINRRDDAVERANPLLIEVGDDQQTWTQIARHDGVFARWRTRFSPVTARYVRVRVPRRSWLHLESVKLFK